MEGKAMLNRMTQSVGILGSAMILCAAGLAMAQSIAITEFLNNADGEDDGAEWMELYNYGTADIDLTGWTVSDEDIDSYPLDGITIKAGDFIILVGGSSAITGADKKARFESEWLGGRGDDRVHGIDDNWAFGNSGDEIILTDDMANVVWNLAYDNDETNAFATFLTDDEYMVTDYGSKAAPGIVREGDDNGMPGFLGYESQDSTLAIDLNAYMSSNGDTGSPLFLSDLGLFPPTLTISGTCPDSVTIEVFNATPGGTVAFIFALGTGSIAIPGGNPCEGTPLGLNASAQLVVTKTADATGYVTFTRSVPAVACNGYLQALDVATCETTPVQPLQ
jgi:hypothetical protein